MPTNTEIPAAECSIVLVGNPNVGKSLLFRNLTRRYVTVSNYPGTTVELVRARASFNGLEQEVVDTPGLNDLSPRSDEARVTRGLLTENPGATIVQIADAKNLRRALLLTLQLVELQRPMVLVLNMYDELEARGGSVDADRLSEILGIPVVVTVAPRNEGTEDLVDALPRARVPDPQVLRVGPPTRVDTVAGPQPQLSGAQDRLSRVNEIISDTYSIDQPKGASLGVRIGFWAMHPVKGMAFLAAILLTVFWFVGLFGAGTLVDALEIAGFEQRLSPLAIRATDALLPFPHEHVVETVPYTMSLPVSPAHELEITRFDMEVIRPPYTIPGDTELSGWQSFLRFVHDFMVGPFGLITMALSYAFAIVLPIVTIFFFVFSILEDSGYFARMSIMLNRAFRVMGLNGKAVLPMILGLGCVTMATMTTRILQTRKERLVTTMLLVSDRGARMACPDGGDSPYRRLVVRPRVPGPAQRLHSRDSPHAPAADRQRIGEDGNAAGLVPSGSHPGVRDRNRRALRDGPDESPGPDLHLGRAAGLGMARSSGRHVKRVPGRLHAA